MDYNMIWQVFVVGLGILFVAIIANMLANVLGLTTWYAFIENIGKLGLWEALSKEKIFSLLFMFVLYPLILGATGYYLARFFL